MMARLRESIFDNHAKQLDWNHTRFILLNWATFTAAQSLMQYTEGASILISASVSFLFLMLLGIVQFFPKTTYWSVWGMFIVAHSGWIFLYYAEAGMFGIAPFIFIAGLVIFTSLFNSWTRVTVVAIMILTSFIVIYFTDLIPLDFVPEPKNSVNYSYIVFTVFICLMLIYLKNNLHYSTEMVLSANEELRARNQQLAEQGLELRTNREKIELINGSLNQMVNDRVTDILINNEELSEYAFVNAHLLRAPLTRVLGLINLLEARSGVDKQQLNKIREHATNTDQIVKKINRKLS